MQEAIDKESYMCVSEILDLLSEEKLSSTNTIDWNEVEINNAGRLAKPLIFKPYSVLTLYLFLG